MRDNGALIAPLDDGALQVDGFARRLQRVRLFLRSLVLYRPWIPGEHRRGTCAVECVAAHLRGFEEDSRSGVVFWIEVWSIEFVFTVSSSRNMCCGVRCSTSSRVLAQLDLLWYFMMSKAYRNVVYLLPKVLHEKLAKLHVLAL